MMSSGLAMPLIPEPSPTMMWVNFDGEVSPTRQDLLKNLPAMNIPVSVAPDCSPAPRATTRLPMKMLYFLPIQSAKFGAIGNEQTEPTD